MSNKNNAPPALTVGSPAPALKVSRFLKGEPVTSFESGTIYVIEFWATWCGPCVEAMPHVSALQKQFPKVTFIGVNVWEKDEAAAVELVKKLGTKLEYRIARDEIPDGNADNGVMSTTWLKAAEISGIPTAIVVD
ncbi:MAG: TlpA family protein disulfide reductase, partial [Planctomycetaceae bacterium]|nr:TlpA family protein disulfide reductase [Planctomycetaceae bacterium]